MPGTNPSAGAAQCSPPAARLFDDAAPPEREERFDTILECRNLVIERIVSSAVVTPRRYVQPQDEGVLMVRGEAALSVDGRTVLLEPGSHVFLPAGTPHVVERVAEGAVWLAVHLHPGCSSPQNTDP
jgi:cupin 2 domain-containing protein